MTTMKHGERVTRVNDGSYTPYERRLRVSRAINPDGLHIDVRIASMVAGDSQFAGLNLTVGEAATLVGHIARVLAEIAADGGAHDH